MISFQLNIIAHTWQHLFNGFFGLNEKKFIQGDVSKLLDHEGVTSNKEIGFQVQASKLAQTIMKQGAPVWVALELSAKPRLSSIWTTTMVHRSSDKMLTQGRKQETQMEI